MDPDDYYSEEVIRYQLTQWLYIGLLTLIAGLMVYFLWKWCRDQSDSTSNSNGDQTTSGSGRMIMKPVYAHEIEQGIVVLQSEDGEYFKVLKEYNLRKESGNQYGSLSCTQPEMTKPVEHMTLPVDQSASPSAPMQPMGGGLMDPLLGNTKPRQDFKDVELLGYSDN